MTNEQLISETYQMYLDGKLQEAYDYITLHRHETENESEQIYNFRYTIACALGKKELGLSIFREAIIDQEFWYTARYLESNRDLDILKDNEEFQRLLTINKAREETYRYSGTPAIEVMKPEKTSEKLLIALHGNSQSISELKKHLDPNGYRKQIIAYPVSSELSSRDAHVWTNIKRSVQEVKKHYQALLKKYHILPTNVSFASFSAGCSVVLDGVINEEFQSNRIMFVGPWLPNLNDMKPQLRKLKDLGTRVFIVCGDQDRTCFPWANQFAELLKEHQIEYKYTIIKGLKHEFPVNFDEILKEGYDFLYHDFR